MHSSPECYSATVSFIFHLISMASSHCVQLIRFYSNYLIDLDDFFWREIHILLAFDLTHMHQWWFDFIVVCVYVRACVRLVWLYIYIYMDIILVWVNTCWSQFDTFAMKTIESEHIYTYAVSVSVCIHFTVNFNHVCCCNTIHQCQ